MSSPEASQSPSQEPASAPGGDQAAETRPPPPPPPPSAPAVPSLEGAWAPYADAPAPAIDLTPRPADITIVRTAEELQEVRSNTRFALCSQHCSGARAGTEHRTSTGHWFSACEFVRSSGCICRGCRNRSILRVF